MYQCHSIFFRLSRDGPVWGKFCERDKVNSGDQFDKVRLGRNGELAGEHREIADSLICSFFRVLP